MPDAEISIATPRMKKIALNRPSAIAPTTRPTLGPLGGGVTELVPPAVDVGEGEGDGDGDGEGVGVGAREICSAWLPTSDGNTALMPSDEVALM